MKNLTPEMIAKAKAAKSAEALQELAKAHGIALSAEVAKTYFAQLHANDVVADDELDAVAGGCGTDEEKTTTSAEEHFSKCPECGARIPNFYVTTSSVCPACKKKIIVGSLPFMHH